MELKSVEEHVMARIQKRSIAAHTRIDDTVKGERGTRGCPLIHVNGNYKGGAVSHVFREAKRFDESLIHCTSVRIIPSFPFRRVSNIIRRGAISLPVTLEHTYPYF